MEELTLLVLTLARDPWKGRDLRSRHGSGGGGALRASLPHSWGSQPKPVPQASSWSGMLGFPRSGKYWQSSFHDVTRSAPAWPSPSPVTTREG